MNDAAENFRYNKRGAALDEPDATGALPWLSPKAGAQLFSKRIPISCLCPLHRGAGERFAGSNLFFSPSAAALAGHGAFWRDVCGLGDSKGGPLPFHQQTAVLDRVHRRLWFLPGTLDGLSLGVTKREKGHGPPFRNKIE